MASFKGRAGEETRVASYKARAADEAQQMARCNGRAGEEPPDGQLQGASSSDEKRLD